MLLRLQLHVPEADCFRRIGVAIGWFGGANRDRTGDLKLAKLALSQLSYGPVQKNKDGLPRVARGYSPGFALWATPGTHARYASEAWWARDELNVRPHAYQACALTT